jgi:beta-mannosidase
MRASLDGDDWQVRGFLGVDAASAAAERARDDVRGWLPASVPGSIVDDLWHAGEVPDPYVERNSLAIEWVPERAWLYRRSLPRVELGALDRVHLRFDGVDHGARVYVDGALVARHEGMFVPFEVDIGEQLRREGEHFLAVLVEPAPECEPQIGRTSRVHVHKSRMTYGWDFCPRMIHQGIWRSVHLETTGAVRIRDVQGRSALARDLTRGTVSARVVLDAAVAGDARVEAFVVDAGTTVAQVRREIRLSAGEYVVELPLEVRPVRSWWPNGMGEQPLYQLRIEVSTRSGETLDERDVPLGFRTIELQRNEGAAANARPYTFVVNGERTYANGWNWVPMDVLYGVPRRDRLGHLIRLARDAHVNLLRVWGGGLIESYEFYDACDRAGIMVWQEFGQSSSGAESTPAADAGFVQLMTRDAEAIVPTRTNHPSLALWCGGNELQDEHGPLDDTHPVLAALRDVVARLDPGRAWLPTSPTGPHFDNRLDVIAADPDGLHDVHGPWEHQGLEAQYELWNRGTALLNSEFGVEGMTNRRTHEALISPGHREPPTRDNPVYRHLGDWWINEPLVQAAFGGRLDDLESLRRASQFLQAEGLRYAVESNRRRAFRSSGSLPWQFNESYPNAWCTAAVDHHGDPKPAYFGVRRAYEPVHVSAAFDGAAWAGRSTFSARVWAWNAVGHDVADVRAQVRGVDGACVTVEKRRVELRDGRPVEALTIEATRVPDPLFVLDLELVVSGARVSTNRYLLSAGADFAPLLDVERTRIAVDRRVEGDAWELELCHVAGPAAIGIAIDDDRPIDVPGWAEPGDGGFELFPGERRTVVVRWAGAPVDGRRLRIHGWNIDPIIVG